MTDMSGYALSVAEDNRRLADANARVAREWMEYAEKLKAKLAAVEQERDALRKERNEFAALAARLAVNSRPTP